MPKKTQEEKIRFNLQVSTGLKHSLDKLAESKGVRTSVFVKTVLQELVDEYQQKKLEQSLIEGYQYLAEEHKQICEDFKYVDPASEDQ